MSPEPGIRARGPSREGPERPCGLPHARLRAPRPGPHPPAGSEAQEAAGLVPAPTGPPVASPARAQGGVSDPSHRSAPAGLRRHQPPAPRPQAPQAPVGSAPEEAKAEAGGRVGPGLQRARRPPAAPTRPRPPSPPPPPGPRGPQPHEAPPPHAPSVPPLHAARGPPPHEAPRPTRPRPPRPRGPPAQARGGQRPSLDAPPPRASVSRPGRLVLGSEAPATWAGARSGGGRGRWTGETEQSAALTLCGRWDGLAAIYQTPGFAGSSFNGF